MVVFAFFGFIPHSFNKGFERKTLKNDKKRRSSHHKHGGVHKRQTGRGRKKVKVRKKRILKTISNNITKEKEDEKRIKTKKKEEKEENKKSKKHQIQPIENERK